METTGRDDVGTDLHAPRFDDAGRENWTYALVREVEDGDVVFHYEKSEHAITSWSRAAGGWWADEIVWGTPRSTSSRGPVAPYERPGLCHGLHGPFPLSEPLALGELRAAEGAIRTALDAVEAAYDGTLYLPFQLRDDGLRAFQGYLAKMPVEIVRALPKLAAAADEAAAVPPEVARPRRIPSVDRMGRRYRPADETTAVSDRDPFPVDPAVVERGVRGHARVQNALARRVSDKGLAPLSPARDDPLYDLLWRDGDTLCVAEVKSLTSKNEERQLRLGLGQLLRYRQRLAASRTVVRAFLVVERRPRDPGWEDLCDETAVVLVWPSVMADRV